MNKIILGVALMLSLASCQQGQKIAFVDNSKLLDDYQEKKDLEALLKGKIDKYQHKRDSISQAFQVKAQAPPLQLQLYHVRSLQVSLLPRQTFQGL